MTKPQNWFIVVVTQNINVFLNSELSFFPEVLGRFIFKIIYWGGGLIITIFAGIIVGTAFVYDIYFRKIPNCLLIAGYAGLLPLVCARLGWCGAGRALVGVLAVGAPLFVVYLIGGIGAGDVKLMGLMGGFLGARQGLVYTVLVLFIGAFAGIVKMLADTALRISEKNKTQKRRTSIRFSVPILIGYLMLLISKGGVI